MITILGLIFIMYIFKDVPAIQGFSNDALLIFSGIMLLSLVHEFKSNK